MPTEKKISKAAETKQLAPSEHNDPANTLPLVAEQPRQLEPGEHPFLSSDVTLIPGAHLILVANDKGGIGKSCAAIELYLACLLAGISVILVTYDGSNNTLAVAFGDKSKITYLNIADLTQTGLCNVMDAAEKANAVVVIDTPAGYSDPGHPLIAALKRSGVFAGENSIAAYIPAKPDSDAIQGALKALAVMPIKFSRGLIRAWRHDPMAPDWADFPGWAALTAEFPVWNLGDWLPSTTAIIHHTGDFAEFPGLDDLHEFTETSGGTLPRRQRKALVATLAHFDEAGRMIYQHLLKPLIA